MTNELEINRLRHKILTMLTFEERMYIQPLLDKCLALAESEEKPKGEWIVGEYMDCHSDILPEYTCPFCGEVAYRKYDYCHCGADLRKETEQ